MFINKHKLIRRLGHKSCTFYDEVRFAGKYYLERKLYTSLGGLGRVWELLSETRLLKFLRKMKGLSLSEQQEWDKIAQFLQCEFGGLHEFVIRRKASQPICSVKPEMPYQDKSDEESDGVAAM